MPRRAAAHRQRGVGLVEILVAVLILSIGLLGIALVQTRALSQNNSSMARSMAVVASYSILDAIRGDRANALTGSYNQTVTGSATGSGCPDLSSLANRQLNAWCVELGKTLGAVTAPTGRVSCSTAGICTVTITFDDSRVGAGGNSAQTVVTKAML
ncbi:type IV pilus modification protein PilV [Solimonas terrae]|uniref:Type IV pilus modification protein PilV n=1 Tax=Solimonas terrae TaxID=1396819 RepID=A0A6M2BUC3_9GAMM|nr:type IV pilus modification protein PilV [Solimonas terrae]NGY06282.1 type IV pilus modification protein PilV [Solimonas terrae]